MVAAKWYVWAASPDNAVEELYHCNEYKTKEEALRKRPVGQPWFLLFEVTAEEIKE